MRSFFTEYVPPKNYSLSPHFTLERKEVNYNMNTMSFKNKKEEEEFKQQLERSNGNTTKTKRCSPPFF